MNNNLELKKYTTDEILRELMIRIDEVTTHIIKDKEVKLKFTDCILLEFDYKNKK